VEQICDHVGVMHVGKLVAQAPLARLRAGVAARARLETDRPEPATEVFAELGLADIRTEPGPAGAAVVTAALGPLAPEKVVAALVHAGVGVRGFAASRADLEELFVSLTGEGFDVSG
jgi:ABC-2 type transport system ATP-binding protein